MYKILLICIVTLIGFSAFGQETKSKYIYHPQTTPITKATGLPTDRPIVGLVLSGGGAKGFAHVGMLKILDSLGIPVDYVAGTSMGAVIGSLYALGYTPKQMDSLVTSIDWVDIMSDSPKRKYLSPLNKNTNSRYIIQTNIQGTKIISPSGFISGQKMLFLLNKVTQGYHGEKNFLTDFPRKFIAVVADLQSGEEDVFTHGSLPDVIRASVSIPTMFMPHRIDGRYKVDGGAVNNFPSNHLKELGCDIVIGFSVQSEEPDSLGEISIIDILEMTGMFVDTKSNEERQKLCDIVVHPDLKGFGLTDFTDNDTIIKLGVIGGREKITELQKIANLFKGKEIKTPPPYYFPDSVLINNISVTGLRRRNSNNIIDKFSIETGDSVSINDLDYQLNLLYGTERFKTIQYKLMPNENGSQDLILDVNERISETQVGVNLHFDSDFNAALGFNITKFEAGFDGATLGLDLLVRANFGARLYWDYDRGKYPGFYFESRFYNAKPSLYVDKLFLGELPYNDWSTFLAYQSTFYKKFNLKLGMALDLQLYDFSRIPELGAIINENLKTFHMNWIVLQMGLDDLNNRDFPTSGKKLEIEGRLTQLMKENLEVFTFDPFVVLHFDYKHAITPRKWLTFIPKVRAGTTLLNESSFPYRFFGGSFGRNNINFNRPYPGYRFMEYQVFEDGDWFWAQNIASAELSIRFNTGKLGYFTLMGGVGSASYNISNIFTQYFSGFGLSYSLNTLFGPIQLVVHKSGEYSNVYGYISIGYWM